MGNSRPQAKPGPAEIDTAYRIALHRYIDRPTVTGIAIGPKIKGGKAGGTAIRIYVEEKFDEAALGKREIFPTEIHGVPTDVIPRRYGGHVMSDAERRLRRSRAEPLQPGIGISLPGGGSGTLGLIVRKDEPPHDLGILTAAHVVALAGAAAMPIIQPPASFGGAAADKIADLGAFLLPSLAGEAAFCRLTTPRRLNVKPLGIAGRVNGIASLSLICEKLVVEKSGMATGVTRGQIEAVGTIKYRPTPGSPMVTSRGFEIENESGVTGRLSREGDSGSIWVNPVNGFGVGLHVAGELHSDPALGNRAFACFLEEVFQQLQIELIPASESQASPRFTDDDAHRV